MINILRIFAIATFINIRLFAHCQIPCGIYSDAAQIIQIKEDLQTIEKSILMINKLSNLLEKLHNLLADIFFL